MTTSIRNALAVPHKLAPPQVLEFLNNAKTALAAIEDPVEAAQFVKQAEAIQYLAKKAQLSLDVQHQATKVALLAEGKAGELLEGSKKRGERAGGGGKALTGAIEEVKGKKGSSFRARVNINGQRVNLGATKTRKEAEGRISAHLMSIDAPKPPTLAELGIRKQDALTWQTLAKIPSSKLEKHIDEVIEAGGEPTTAEALRFVQRETAPTAQPVPSIDSVGVAYKFLDQAQIMARLFQTRSPSQLWKEASAEETKYMKRAFKDTIRLINKLLEAAN